MSLDILEQKLLNPNKKVRWLKLSLDWTNSKLVDQDKQQVVNDVISLWWNNGLWIDKVHSDLFFAMLWKIFNLKEFEWDIDYLNTIINWLELLMDEIRISLLHIGIALEDRDAHIWAKNRKLLSNLGINQNKLVGNSTIFIPEFYWLLIKKLIEYRAITRQIEMSNLNSRL